MFEIADYNQAFQHGALLPCEVDGKKRVVEVQQIGELRLVSGWVVVCDPIAPQDWQLEPYKLKVPPGLYSVFLSIVDLGKSWGKQNACAMVRLAEDVSAHWQVAVKGELTDSVLDNELRMVYGVDRGMGCFMDTEAAKMLKQKFDDDHDGTLNTIRDEMKKHEGRWANIVLDRITGLNALLFTSGLGDGVYTSFWGYKASWKVKIIKQIRRSLGTHRLLNKLQGTGYADDEEVVCLVTDFALLERTMRL